MLPDLDVVVLRGPAEAENATGLGIGSIQVTPAGARRSLDDRRPLSLTRVRELALSWRKLSGRSPILSGKGGPAARERKELSELGGYQAGFFPRFGVRGLVLSRFDELLFSCFEKKQWSTPVEIFVSRRAAGDELRKWLSLTGDVFLAARLAQWATHDGGGAALTSEPHETENRMKEARYRLSEVGHAIKRHGLGEIDRGAPLPVWGVTAYSSLSPWVVVDDQTGRERLKRLEERSAQNDDER